MTITIKDVAKAAGVAVSTVSKVMSDSPTISRETKERVRQLMTELGYHPNRAARALAQGSALSIGVLMRLERDCAFTNPYIFEILCGIESVSQRQGFTVTLCNERDLGKGSGELQRLLSDRRVDGLIVHAAAGIKPLLDTLLAHQLPFVVIGKPGFAGNFSWVDIDNEYAGYLAAEHLIQCGYQRLAFVGGPATDTISSARLAGFQRALAAHGRPLQPQWIGHGDGDTASDGARLLGQWQAQMPDAVVASGNLLALGVVQQAKSAGLTIGQELGVITFDNHPVAAHAEPPLTVVDIDLFELGAQASRALFAQLQTPPQQSQSQLLNGRLIQRLSTQTR